MMVVTRHPDCPVCGRTQDCRVQKVGRDRMTVSCGGCTTGVYFTFEDATLVDKGTL